MDIAFPQALLALATLVIPVLIARYRYLSSWWAIAAASAICAYVVVDVANHDDWYYSAIFCVFLASWAAFSDVGYKCRNRIALTGEDSGNFVKAGISRESFTEALELLVGCALNIADPADRRRRALLLYPPELRWQVADRAKFYELNPVVAAMGLIILAAELALHRTGFLQWVGSVDVRVLRRDHAAMSNIDDVIANVYAKDAIADYDKNVNPATVKRFSKEVATIVGIDRYRK